MADLAELACMHAEQSSGHSLHKVQAAVRMPRPYEKTLINTVEPVGVLVESFTRPSYADSVQNSRSGIHWHLKVSDHVLACRANCKCGRMACMVRPMQ